MSMYFPAELKRRNVICVAAEVSASASVASQTAERIYRLTEELAP